jgi:hypothetical protein
MGKRATTGHFGPVDPLAHVPAWLCGAAGGAVSAFAQFIGNTLHETVGFFFAGQSWSGMTNIFDFLIATVFTAVCGVPVAYFLQSKTQNRWMLFLAGVTARRLGGFEAMRPNMPRPA